MVVVLKTLKASGKS